MRGGRFTRIQARGLIAAALVSLVGAGFSAQALGPGGAKPAATAPATGYEADDHFPGALYYTAVADEEAYAAGTTGTAPLPDLPAPAETAADASIQPARPFALRGSAQDQSRALQCLTAAIYYEAASEPDNGQRAVAQVVLNRVRHPSFPSTVCGVVYQGSEKRGCQFSFACDGSLNRGAPNRAAWLRAGKAAAAALNGEVFAPVGLATHYHTFAVTPSWNRSLVMTGVFGAHFFHRWKGGWGTPAAFTQAYRGGEPVPGPHPSAAAVVPTPVVAAPAVVPPTPAAAIQPRYRDSGTPQPGTAPALPESTILDKWKDTGKPLR